MKGMNSLLGRNFVPCDWCGKALGEYDHISILRAHSSECLTLLEKKILHDGMSAEMLTRVVALGVAVREILDRMAKEE